jgi:sortase A
MSVSATRVRRVLLMVERSALAIGLAAALIVVAAVGLKWAAQGEAKPLAYEASAAAGDQADQRDWGASRIKAFRESLNRLAPQPLATLRIPRIGLRVNVLEGTDDFTLNRAVGHIADTAAPGSTGNVGLAGHRDGFFRGLKDIAVGDLIEVGTGGRVDKYRVQKIWIVAPGDVWVLDPTDSPALTLVTCYPFYFIGSAPKRFIVRAAREDVTETGLSTGR